MGDETPNTMNLDLNLGPVVHPLPNDEPGSESWSNEILDRWRNGSGSDPLYSEILEHWRNVSRSDPLYNETSERWRNGSVSDPLSNEILEGWRNGSGSESLSNESRILEHRTDGSVHRLREAVRHRNVRHRAGQRWRSVWRPVPIPPETRSIALELMGGSGLETGEGSVAAEERPTEATKTCDINNGCLGDGTLGKKEDVEKGYGDGGSFFDCNICLDLAREPVVTCCGHLFCWPCLYRWLHVHSDAKECPICKGEVTIKNLTPIYGRGNITQEKEEDSSLKIPQRPQARRVESWRQAIQRNAFSIPMGEMIRRLGSRFDLTRDVVQVHPDNPDNPQELPERPDSLLDLIMSSRGMRGEQNTIVPPDDSVDLTQSNPTDSAVGERRRRLSSLLHRRSHSHRAANISNLTSVVSSGDSLMETYLRWERNHVQPPPVEDRDSVSSIAAVIQSESQTADTAIEIDSFMSHLHSSRRRNDASRVSEVDTAIEIDSFMSHLISSRRRTDGSRVSEVDSGDSQAPSQSRIVDTAVDDSRVSLINARTGRRNDASRISEVGSGDSRAPRRRRLN